MAHTRNRSMSKRRRLLMSFRFSRSASSVVCSTEPTADSAMTASQGIRGRPTRGRSTNSDIAGAAAVALETHVMRTISGFHGHLGAPGAAFRNREEVPGVKELLPAGDPAAAKWACL